MKIEIDTEIDQVVILQKKTIGQFALSEVLIYLSQIIVFFWVAFLVSSSLNDEDRLVKYLDTRINQNSLSEVGYIILATVITLGILAIVSRAAHSDTWLDELDDDVLSSISRTIYFFGSSVTGSILAVALFSHLNPTKDNPNPEFWLSLSLVFGLGAFLYGCGTSYVFKRKRFIVKSSPNTYQATGRQE